MQEKEEVIHIPLNKIKVVSNTRSAFDENGLKEMAQSIKTNGILQPVIVRKEENGFYRLICGERRYRSSLLAGKVDIRATVKEIRDEDILPTQIVENLQRRNVSTMDEVRSIMRLRDENSMTTEEIAKTIGKAKSHVEAQIRIGKAVPALHEALDKKSVSRAVGVLISALDSPEKQISAVEALKRDNPAYAVTKNNAEKWINTNFGAQPKQNFGRGQTKTKKGRFASEWKYYLIRFSGEQFIRWQSFVNNRTETEVLAEAVELVMKEQEKQTA